MLSKSRHRTEVPKEFTTDAKGRKVCGARRKVCACGHYRREHRVAGGRDLGPCRAETGCACQAFAPKRCQQFRLAANGRCEHHGGKTPSGIMSPHYRGKGYSDVLPRTMQADYEEGLADPHRLSLQAELSQLRAMLKDVWRRMGDGALIAEDVFRGAASVATAWRGFQRAHRTGDAALLADALTGMEDAVSELHAAMAPAKAYAAARDETVKITNTIERVARSENTRLAELHNMISVERALADRHAFVTAFIEAVNKHATEEVARAIRSDATRGYARLVGRRDVEAAGPGGQGLLGAGPQDPNADH